MEWLGEILTTVRVPGKICPSLQFHLMDLSPYGHWKTDDNLVHRNKSTGKQVCSSEKIDIWRFSVKVCHKKNAKSRRKWKLSCSVVHRGIHSGDLVVANFSAHHDYHESSVCRCHNSCGVNTRDVLPKNRYLSAFVSCIFIEAKVEKKNQY